MDDLEIECQTSINLAIHNYAYKYEAVLICMSTLK